MTPMFTASEILQRALHLFSADNTFPVRLLDNSVDRLYLINMDSLEGLKLR